MNVDKLVEEYKRARPKSEELHEQAINFFAANGATHRARVMDPYQPYITHASGSKKWDVDGIEYIDYVLGHGALLLGHCYPEIVKAVQEQAAKGFHYGANHELELEWAGLIRSIMPSAERVEFFACGQEANLMAIKLSRLFTGRKKIMRFFENFHGWADELILMPDSPGVVADYAKVLPLPFDLNQIEAELATKEYAILFIEGGGAHMGQIPPDFNSVREIANLAQKYGTIFHMDEVVTGFRDAPGGFQSIIGIKPDLTSLGKVIAGGLAAGALIGRADIFDCLNPKTSVERRTAHTGTWNGLPITSAAGIAGLKALQSGDLQKKVREMAAYLRREANKVFKEKNISGWLYGGSVTHLYLGSFDFQPADDTLPPSLDSDKIVGLTATKARLGVHLLHRGVALMAAGSRVMMSCAHTREDVDKTVVALADSLDAMIEEDSLKLS